MGPKEFIMQEKLLDRDKTVDTILEERGDVYGDYSGGIHFRLGITNLIKSRYKEVNGEDIDDELLYLFNDVIGKLSRLAVSPAHVDSWKDLAGYSLLVEEIVKNEVK